MANPTTEGNSLLDPKGFHELLKAVPLRAIAEDAEAGQIVSQKGSSRAQPKITSFGGDQSPEENQLKFAVALRTGRGTGTQGTTDAVLRDKEKFVAVCGKLGIRLGRGRHDRCRVAVGGSRKRQEPVQIPEAGDPFLLVIGLAETLHKREPASSRPDHEGYRSLPQEERERTRQHRSHR